MRLVVRWLFAPLLFVSLAVPALAHDPQDPTSSRGLGTQEKKNPLAKQGDAFAGRWQGGGLKLELIKGKGTYTGWLELDGARYPLKADRELRNMSGSFEVDGESYPFDAERSKTGITLRSGGSEYALTREAATAPSRNPLQRSGKPGADPASAGASGVSSVERARALDLPVTRSVKHPLGFQFQHPEKWTVQNGDEGYLVLPAEAEKDAQGQPLELVLISAEDASEVSRPDQPEVLAFFDDAMRQMFPGMKRSTEPTALDCLIGPGVVLRYSGKTPTGLDGHADVYLTLYRSLGVYMLHLGRADLIEARREPVRRMFSSFGWKKATLDSSLVGLWHRNEGSSSTTIGIEGSLDTVGTDSNLYWQFRPDGAVVYTWGTRVFGNVGGGSDGSLPSVSLFDAEGSKNASVGSWSAEKGKLSILWNEGGVETYSYSVFPHTEGRVGLKIGPEGEEEGRYFIRQ